MNAKSKIHKLWDYLQVQDDELLIVRSFNILNNSDEYFVTEKTDDELKIIIMNAMPEIRPGTPFQMIQQIGPDGRHRIPSVEQLEEDELMDY